MAVQRGLLLIADIAGYTRFMEFHRTDLAHAQDVVARLLEAMIDATSALDLVEVEGDAAFMYRPLPGGTGPELVESALGQSVAMHGAFHALQQKIACLNNCPCQGCAQVGNRSEEHTSELQSRLHLVCRLLLEKKKKNNNDRRIPDYTTSRE